MYHYNAILHRVIDGDTVVLTVDLGFGVFKKETFRLNGINAPEKNRKSSREQGLKSFTALTNYLSGKDLQVRSLKLEGEKEKYGRYMADIVAFDTEKKEWVNVSQWMLDNKYAVPYTL